MAGADQLDALDDDGPDEVGRLIRPYAITGGRTKADDIDLEVLVQVNPRASVGPGRYRWEAARVLELAASPVAIVELAARVEVPVGVMRVLVADLVDDGAVILHQGARTQQFSSLLERVLDGVKKL